MKIIDIADKTDPALEGTYDDGDAYAYDVVIEGLYAYLAYGTEGMKIIDVSDPTTPALEVVFYDGNSINSIFISGMDAYVSESDGLKVLTWMEDPSEPLVILLYNNHNHSVSILWDEPSYNGGEAIIGYNIYRGTNSVDLEFVGTTTERVYLDTSMPVMGDVYFYEVTALNKHFEGVESEVQSIEVTSAPGAPQNLVLTRVGDSVNVTWDAPLDDGGKDVDAYFVFKKDDAHDFELINSSLGDVTHYFDDAVDLATTYYYYVRAANDDGAYWGVPTDTESIFLYCVPTAPINLYGFVSHDLIEEAELDWLAPSSTGGYPILNYNIYRGDSAETLSILATVSATTLEYNDSTIEGETDYYYAVTAVNSLGESDFSNIILVEIPEIPTDDTTDETTSDTSDDPTSETTEPGDTTNEPTGFSLFYLLGIFLVPVIVRRKR